ncbi:hypothetical protein RD792_013931, partial [Penstemon davidsonii]
EPATFIHPGPVDPSVLILQNEHRSTQIWHDIELPILTCRRADSCLEGMDNVDDRVLPYLIRTGFYGVYRIGKIKTDWPLITALVERWRVETHTFHMRIGEATITLQDVEVLLGLPIDGWAVTSSDLPRPIEEWQELCGELFGVIPAANEFDGQFLKLTLFMDKFTELPADANLVSVEYHARARILAMIGGIVLPNKSGNMVSCKYIPLLRDINMIGSYSWGSAALAVLYHELCGATNPDTKQIGGCLTLLQIWAWERISCMRPQILNVPVIDHPGPLGYRWRATKLLRNVPTHVLRVYRDQLDLLTEDQFVWQPYQLEWLPDYCFRGINIWMSKVPLICFERVEWHFPDRVGRQFGMLQIIPVAPPAPPSPPPPPPPREFIPPVWFSHPECSTPNFDTSQHESQSQCVTQADTQTQIGTQGDSMLVGTQGENFGSIVRQTSIKFFRKRFSQRDKRAPNRYTPN